METRTYAAGRLRGRLLQIEGSPRVSPEKMDGQWKTPSARYDIYTQASIRGCGDHLLVRSGFLSSTPSG